MKLLSQVINVLLYLIITILIVTSLCSSILGKPLLMSPVVSNSMFPLFQRGDIVLLSPINSSSIKLRDIVVFKSKEGNFASVGWVVHRIVGGDAVSGYITKGDANTQSDQESLNTSPIKPEWIADKVIVLGEAPLKIRYFGYLSLWMQQFYSSQYAIPITCLALGLVIFFQVLLEKKPKRKKHKGTNIQSIFFFSGLIVSIIIATSMLITSQVYSLIYSVSANNQGVIQGSSIGIIKLGEQVDKPLSQLSNNSFLPLVATLTTNDAQITFSDTFLFLKPNDFVVTRMKVTASKVGEYTSQIRVSTFIPLLPSKIIYYLATKSYWLTIILISLIPGLPIMLYPLINANLRRKTWLSIKKSARRISNLVTL